MNIKYVDLTVVCPHLPLDAYLVTIDNVSNKMVIDIMTRYAHFPIDDMYVGHPMNRTWAFIARVTKRHAMWHDLVSTMCHH